MKPVRNKKIAIVGAGPGGLTLARLLQLKKAEVTVYERDLNKEARVQGATLDLHEESGLRAIREAGLVKAFEENYRPGADLMRIVDKSGRIIFDEHGMSAEESAAYPDRPEIDRGPLRKLLIDSLETGTIKWNHRFVSLSRKDEAWTIHFDNAADAEADIVIAADGANSRLRTYVTDVKPVYSGITAIEGAVYGSAGSVPEMHELLNGGKIFAMGDEKSLIVSSKGDGSLAFYFGLKTAADWSSAGGVDFSDRAQLLRWFGSAFEGWSPIWSTLIEKATLPLWPRPQFCVPFDQTWNASPNITLIGDAAHLMPPYAGEGVNMAMLDAVELADCLTNDRFEDSRSAIAEYERNMRRRAAETAADTMKNTEGLHGRDGIGFMLNMFRGE